MPASASKPFASKPFASKPNPFGMKPSKSSAQKLRAEALWAGEGVQSVGGADVPRHYLGCMLVLRCGAICRLGTI